MEDWAEIRRLHRGEGLPIKAILRVLGISRNTVRAAIASDVLTRTHPVATGRVLNRRQQDAPPKYERTPAGSIVDEVEPAFVNAAKLFADAKR